MSIWSLSLFFDGLCVLYTWKPVWKLAWVPFPGLPVRLDSPCVQDKMDFARAVMKKVWNFDLRPLSMRGGVRFSRALTVLNRLTSRSSERYTAAETEAQGRYQQNMQTTIAGMKEMSMKRSTRWGVAMISGIAVTLIASMAFAQATRRFAFVRAQFVKR